MQALTNLLRARGHVNVLMLSPTCDAALYGGQQDYGRKADVTRYRNSVTAAFEAFRQLRLKYRGQVEIRTIDFPLTFGMDAIDIGDTRRGVIVVLFYPLHSAIVQGDKPVLVLRPNQPAWYQFYERQLEIQWHEFGVQTD